jgi:hypothetical protein
VRTFIGRFLSDVADEVVREAETKRKSRRLLQGLIHTCENLLQNG